MKKILNGDELVELKVYAFMVTGGSGRPVLILKGPNDLVLPVWLNPLEAGVALSDNDPRSTAVSPHRLTHKVVEMFNATLDRCEFRDLVGHHQYVDLVFKKNDEELRLRQRAEEAMGLCLVGSCRFYARLEFIDRSRRMDIELQTGQSVHHMVEMIPGNLPELPI